MGSFTARVAIVLVASALAACQSGPKTSFDQFVDETGRNRPVDMQLEDVRICKEEIQKTVTTRGLRDCMEMKGWKARGETTSGYGADRK